MLPCIAYAGLDMITFQCGTCSKEINVADASAGKRGRCPQCKAVVEVPVPAPTTPDYYTCSVCSGMFPMDLVYDIEGSVVCTTCYDRQQQDALYELAQTEQATTPTSTRYEWGATPATEGIRDVMMPRKRGTKKGSNWPLRIAIAAICGVIAFGFHLLAGGSNPLKSNALISPQKPSTAGRGADLSRELEQDARKWLPARIRGAEDAAYFLEKFQPGQPDAPKPPPKANYTWVSTFNSAVAEPLEGDQKYDAVGTLTYKLDRGAGKPEAVSERYGRKRADGKWETFSKTDPAVLAALIEFKEAAQPLAEQLRQMGAMRAVGGNVLQHANVLIALEAAYKGAPQKPSASGCSGFLFHCRNAIEAYHAAVKNWRLSIEYSDNPQLAIPCERQRDKALAEGDKHLADAISRYKDIEKSIADEKSKG